VTSKRARVRFSFSAAPAGASFECRLDRAALARCSSPASYALGPGRHTFSVRASANGLRDESPASFSFVVKHRR